MNTITLLKKLGDIGKGYYTPADIGKITGLSGGALKVRLNRLIKSGIIERLSRGMYGVPGMKTDTERAANDAVYPSYISFGSALSKYGVISEVPYVLEFATTKGTRKKQIGGMDVLYRKLQKKLFFGYTMSNGVMIAEPEKAVLDMVYLKAAGKYAGNEAEKLDLRKLDMKKLKKYAMRFPAKARAALEAVTGLRIKR